MNNDNPVVFQIFDESALHWKLNSTEYGEMGPMLQNFFIAVMH